jgi:hypothetical protein
MQNKVIAQACGLMLSGLLIAGAAYAGEPTSAASKQTSVSVQGVQVAIDPATGRLVAPTAAQRAALSRAMLSQPAAVNARTGMALRPQTQADALKTLKRSSTGKFAASMQVPQNMMNGLVAERQANGSIAIRHQDDGATTPAAHHAQEAIR